MHNIERFQRLDPRVQAALISALFVAICYPLHFFRPSADLYALYLAALNYGLGDVAAVYSDPTPMYQLSVPGSWEAQATSIGIEARPLFPFIYPPIWAALFSPIATLVPPGVVAQAAFLINPALMGLCAWLAHRVIRPRMALPQWQFLALAFVGSTSFGFVALSQNQPQILVSLLIIAALERDRANAPAAAGIALALAASIKLYPALFALMWLASRNHRALASFVIFGAALGGVSVLLAGWPLHQEFLGQIKIIAASFMSCQICLNVDATLTQWLMSDFLTDVIGIRDPGSDTVVNVIVSQKSALFQTLDKVLLLGVLVLSYLAMRGASPQDRFRRVWPAVLIAVAFVSPLTWTYHYLSAVFFAPFLIESLGRQGWRTFLGFAVLFSAITLKALDYLPTPYYVAQLLGSAGILVMLALFLWPEAMAQRRRAALSA